MRDGKLGMESLLLAATSSKNRLLLRPTLEMPAMEDDLLDETQLDRSSHMGDAGDNPNSFPAEDTEMEDEMLYETRPDRSDVADECTEIEDEMVDSGNESSPPPQRSTRSMSLKRPVSPDDIHVAPSSERPKRSRRNITPGDVPLPLPQNQNYPVQGRHHFRKLNGPPKHPRTRSGGKKLLKKLESDFNSPMTEAFITRESRHLVAALSSPTKTFHRRSGSVSSSQPRSSSLPPRVEDLQPRRLSFGSQPRDLADGRFAEESRRKVAAADDDSSYWSKRDRLLEALPQFRHLIDNLPMDRPASALDPMDENAVAISKKDFALLLVADRVAHGISPYWASVEAAAELYGLSKTTVHRTVSHFLNNECRFSSSMRGKHPKLLSAFSDPHFRSLARTWCTQQASTTDDKGKKKKSTLRPKAFRDWINQNLYQSLKYHLTNADYNEWIKECKEMASTASGPTAPASKIYLPLQFLWMLIAKRIFLRGLRSKLHESG